MSEHSYIAIAPFAWGRAAAPTEAAKKAIPLIAWSYIKKEVKKVDVHIYQVTPVDLEVEINDINGCLEWDGAKGTVEHIDTVKTKRPGVR